VASAAYERRQAAARAAGFPNYYAQRLALAQARGASRDEARGHARDALDRAIRDPRTTSVIPEPGSRRVDGTYTSVTFYVRQRDGSQRTITLRGQGITDAKLRGIASQMRRAGVTVLPTYPIRKGKPGPLRAFGRPG